MTTATPAAYLGIEDEVGGLQIGQKADISVLDVIEGRWELADATGETRVGTEALAPVVTIKGGKIVQPGDPPHAWGWTPPVAVEMAAAGDGA